MKRDTFGVQVERNGKWSAMRGIYISEESAVQTAQRISEEQHTLTKITKNGKPHKFFLNGKEPSAKEYMEHVWGNVKAGWDKMIDELRALPIRKESADDGNDH